MTVSFTYLLTRPFLFALELFRYYGADATRHFWARSYLGRMSEIRTVTTLRNKRDEIIASIKLYERQLEQARDLGQKLVNSLRKQGLRGQLVCEGKRKGVSVWRSPDHYDSTLV